MTEPARVALRAENVRKAFGATQALRGADLELRQGEIHALVGGNGSGKSTLLKIFAGVHSADGGTIALGEHRWDLSSSASADARRAGLHFVHQQPTTFGSLTVAENLALGRGFQMARFGRISWRATRRHAELVLARFGLKVHPSILIDELSPAAQAMVEIARALQDEAAGGGAVLALDEPTAALAPREVERLLEMLRAYAQAGHTTLFVSHRLEEVLDLADRVTVLRDGETVTTVSTDGLTKNQLAELIVGRSISSYYPEPAAPRQQRAVIEVEDLSGGVVQDVAFQLAAGEIVGIAGLAGSGRSTLLRLLFGAQSRASGVVQLDGEQIALRSPADAIQAGMAYVSENRARDSIFQGLSVTQNLSIVQIGDYFRRGVIQRRREHADGATSVKSFGIRAESARTSISALSGGNQQKVALARWLRMSPRILLLDEPTQGVDVGARSELWSLIQAAASDGASVLLVSSDFEELTHLCSRLLVLRHGRLVGEISDSRTPDEVNHMLQEMQAAP